MKPEMLNARFFYSLPECTFKFAGIMLITDAVKEYIGLWGYFPIFNRCLLLF